MNSPKNEKKIITEVEKQLKKILQKVGKNQT